MKKQKSVLEAQSKLTTLIENKHLRLKKHNEQSHSCVNPVSLWWVNPATVASRQKVYGTTDNL